MIYIPRFTWTRPAQTDARREAVQAFALARGEVRQRKGTRALTLTDACTHHTHKQALFIADDVSNIIKESVELVLANQTYNHNRVSFLLSRLLHLLFATEKLTSSYFLTYRSVLRRARLWRSA